MSRGFGAGRGSGGLKGATWDYDPDLKVEFKPSDLFPPHPDLKRTIPLSDKERRQIKHFKAFQDEIHSGPLYTRPTKRDLDAPAKTFSEDQVNRQYSTNRKADMDPFTGVETYAQRMAAKTNEIPKLSTQSFDLKLFPKELWSTLEGTEGEEVKKHIKRAIDKKAHMFGGNSKDADTRTRTMLEKLHTIGGEEEGEDQDDEAIDEDEEDDEFDDESMGGDYDGEQYFDNGEEGSEAGDGGGDEEF